MTHHVLLRKLNMSVTWNSNELPFSGEERSDLALCEPFEGESRPLGTTSHGRTTRCVYLIEEKPWTHNRLCTLSTSMDRVT